MSRALRHACIPLMLLLLQVSAVPPVEAGEAFVVTTTFELVGSTARMDLDAPYGVVADEYTVHSDAVVRRHGPHVFVLNRLFSDNVLVLDATDGYGVVQQYTITDTGANPRDIEVISPTKAYVTLYEDDLVRVGHPTDGSVSGTIDLSAFADADGLAEVDQMAHLGDLVFVALQNLDRTGGWGPAGSSRLAVIDASTDALVDVDASTAPVDAIELQYQNPFWELRYEPSIQRIVAICSGRFLQLDGALELVNPFSLESEGALVTEATLGGDVLDYVLVDETTGYVLIERPNLDTCLLRFDPSGSATPTEVHCSEGFQLQDLELSSTGRLYLGDRTASQPGIRVFDAASGNALAGPVGVGLPPFDFVMVEYPAVDAPPANTTAALRLRAWPNPFNPRVSLELSPWADSRPAPKVRIVDARGREVARLRPTRAEGALLYRWNGLSTSGQAVASGVYHARPELEGAESTKLVLTR